mgnify:CR=1 FL=1
MIHAVRRGLIPRFIRRVLLGTGLMAGLGISTLASAPQAIAAERVIITLGGLSRSFDVADLRNFAETGEQTPNLRFIFNVADQNPDDVQAIFNEELPVSLRTIDSITYSLPGEYALFQLGRRFSTRSGDANIQALRAGLILSASDDNQVSLIEFLENYPTDALYVDGLQLLDDVRELGDVLEVVNDRIVPYVVAAQEFLEGLVCECEDATSASTQGAGEAGLEPSDSEMEMPEDASEDESADETEEELEVFDELPSEAFDLESDSEMDSEMEMPESSSDDEATESTEMTDEMTEESESDVEELEVFD